jgi:porin
MTGDWGGLRRDLKTAGITVSSNYSTDVAGNPFGGLYQATRYAGFYSLAAALDLQKLASLNGVALTASQYVATGRDLSAAIGNYYSPMEVYTAGTYYLGELDLSVSLLEHKVFLEAGRLFAGDIFAVSPMYQYYMTNAVNGRAESIPNNIFFPHYRTAAWGTRLTYQPNKDWHFIAGLYDADSRVAKPHNRGADFSMDFDRGCLVIGQISYKHGTDKNKDDFPGSASLGGYYESSRFQDLSAPNSNRRGNYGFYLIADQMLFRGEWPDYEGPFHFRSGAMFAEWRRQPHHQQNAVPMDRPKGLTLWGTAVLAPQENINAQTYQLATGLAYQGLPPGRNRDVTAFGFILGHFSGELEAKSNEIVLELNHRFQISPWLYFTPDIQYILNPNGRSDIGNALVLGFETSVNF